MVVSPFCCGSISEQFQYLETVKVCNSMVLTFMLQFKDPKRVVECLKKSGRIASQCMDKNAQVQLLIELVNSYSLFFEKGNSEVS